MLFSFFLSFVFWGKQLSRVWCSKKHFCVCALLTLLLLHGRTARDLRDDIAVTSLSHLSLASRVAFSGARNHFLRGFFSLDFLSAFLKEGRVLFLWFRETKEPKSGFFVHTNNARVFRSPSEGAERRRTRARRVQSLSRNEKDAYFLSLFFFLECATENAADGVNEKKTTREDGSTTNNSQAGKERR